MLSYVTIGTNDLEGTAPFYDTILGKLGGKRAIVTERLIAWSDGRSMVGIIKPYDGNKATVGNGMMVTFSAREKALVDDIHKTALELGGKDEGAPGERPGGIYIGYFRDPEGNKLAVVAA